MKRFLLGMVCMLAAAVAFAGPRPSTATSGVRVLTPPLSMPGLDRQRTIRVYLPPSYRHGKRCYPVLYMHDAQNLFDDATSFVGEWGVDESMDALAKSDGIEVIVVGIDHGGDKRISELSPWPNPKYGVAEGSQYMEFVVGTVKPFIDRTFRTKPGSMDTGIMGSSLGGITSHYAIYRYPDVFGKAGIFSPSYWFSEDVYRYTAARHLRPGSRIYLVAGDSEGDDPATTVNDVMKMQALLRKDPHVALFAAIRPGAQHNETFWKNEFPKAIRFLFGRR